MMLKVHLFHFHHFIPTSLLIAYWKSFFAEFIFFWVYLWTLFITCSCSEGSGMHFWANGTADFNIRLIAGTRMITRPNTRPHIHLDMYLYSYPCVYGFILFIYVIVQSDRLPPARPSFSLWYLVRLWPSNKLITFSDNDKTLLFHISFMPLCEGHPHTRTL